MYSAKLGGCGSAALNYHHYRTKEGVSHYGEMGEVDSEAVKLQVFKTNKDLSILTVSHIVNSARKWSLLTLVLGSSLGLGDDLEGRLCRWVIIADNLSRSAFN